MSALLHLVADDLTGALDSACGFARPGDPVAVSWSSPRRSTAAGFAFSTGTREAPVALARQRAAAAAEAARSAPAGTLLFKKVDSLLRGHPLIELAAFAEVVRPDRIVLAPAHPSLGRVTRGGRQHLRRPDGGLECIRLDLAAGIDACGLGSGTLLADAESDADLEVLVERERKRGGRILWCGSGGLAQALAGGRPPLLPVPEGAVLVIIGTDHPVTTAQVEALRGLGPVSLIEWSGDDDAAPLARLAGHSLRESRITVLRPALASCSRREAGSRIEAMLSALMALLPRPDALFCSGGETLQLVCTALGAEALLCEGLVTDGVPISRLQAGRWPMLPVMSKSGAFGDAQTLVDLLTPSSR